MTTKLPELHLPKFDSTIENWHSFFDSFSATIDQKEHLTPVQKFRYLQSALTGKAAQSIQTLDLTDLNYSIAMDALQEKYNCHRQVCMRHWELILNCPKVNEETPDALDDLLETFKINLKALEKLGQPVTSDVVLISLITSKLPAHTIRKWHGTLLDKKMPSYTHLMDFLKIKVNGDRAISTTNGRKNRAYDKHNRQRQRAPRTHTFTTTNRTLVCSACRGSHELWHCKVFKSMSVKNRLKTVKRGALCTNCLRQGHSVAQCTAGSCRVCERRHHTNLHQAQYHGKSRPSSGQSPSNRSSSSRSSNGRSSSDRSSGRRSIPSSPTPQAPPHARRSDTSRTSPRRSSPRASQHSSRQSSRRAHHQTSRRTSPKREAHSTRTNVHESDLSMSPQRQGKQ